MSQAIEKSQDEQLTIEIASLFPRQGQWTEADYFRLPETNRIMELSEGRLIITPSPTSQHQRIIFRLSNSLGNHILSHNLGEIVTAPMDTRLWKGKIRQPDIAFMSNEHLDRITEQLCGVPDIVIEILSEGTAKVDKEDKYFEYQKSGVQEYWIVDPFNQSIEVYTLKNGIYVIFGKWSSSEIAKSKLLDGFQVDVDSIMAQMSK
jgi:Uma2 family endonuclease